MIHRVMNKPIPDELRPVCGCGRPMKLARFVMDGGKACLDYWTCTAPARQCPVKNANIPVDIIFDENGRID
jgi:hypothetical protein